MLYHLHELNRTLLNPLVAWSGAASRALSSPDNWLSRVPGMDGVAAGYEMLYRLGKDYEKPAFDVTSVVAHGRQAPVVEECAVATPFCNLLRFKREGYVPDRDIILALSGKSVSTVAEVMASAHSGSVASSGRPMSSEGVAGLSTVTV